MTLSACQLASPMTTDEPYDPADGVSVDLGEVQVRDLLVVSEGNGSSGAVSGLVVNRGSEPVTVQLTTQADGPLEPPVEVGPSQTARLDGKGGDGGAAVQLPAVEGAPGGTLAIQVGVQGGDATQVTVPVLEPTGPYAEHVGDDAATTTSP